MLYRHGDVTARYNGQLISGFNNHSFYDAVIKELAINIAARLARVDERELPPWSSTVRGLDDAPPFVRTFLTEVGRDSANFLEFKGGLFAYSLVRTHADIGSKLDALILKHHLFGANVPVVFGGRAPPTYHAPRTKPKPDRRSQCGVVRDWYCPTCKKKYWVGYDGPHSPQLRDFDYHTQRSEGQKASKECPKCYKGGRRGQPDNYWKA
jgi:hypothetical protein